MLTDKTLNDLLDAFAAPTPTPGGGSAAALGGAIGASVLAMVASMPKTKTGAPEERTALDHALATLKTLRTRLVGLVDRDAESYDLVIAAYKQPKTTDAEKAARRDAIQAAMRVATDVPLETMRACADVVAAGKAVGLSGNPSAASDVGAALHLTMAGLTAARLNVEINLGSVTDEAYATQTREAVLLLVVGAGSDFHAALRAAGLSKGPHE